MGTALLSDGFYEYDLFDCSSVPYWFDEFSVGADGVAIDDRTKKGYLGAALSVAQELTSAATIVVQEDFESGAMPRWLTAGGISGAGSVSVTRAPGETISGGASLLVSDPDHTKLGWTPVNTNPPVLSLTPGTYVIQFDWRILETLDERFHIGFLSTDGQQIGEYMLQSQIAGESGTTRFPFTIPGSGTYFLTFALQNGGKVALDNFVIYRGGAGPWRRDFENGFVLVNPLNSAHTFSAAELAGSLNRTGIHRIKGTQAPDVNNGQPVTGELTLAAFDAIILLANHIDAQAAPPSTAKPYIKPGGIISAGAFGGFSTAAPGSWIEIYGSDLSATTRGWAGTDFNGPNAPISLDGVKVTIGGRAAFISYISPGQVNALVPSDVPVGPVQVVVSGPTGTSDPYVAVIEATRPGLLAPFAFQINGKQYVAAFFADNVTFALPSGAIPGVPSRPAKPGETVVLWGIGFGPVTPNVPAGVLVGQANSLSAALQVSFGNTPAKLAYWGLAPQATGLYQFNVVVPDVPDSSAVPLTISLAGVPGTQTLYIAVQH